RRYHRPVRGEGRRTVEAHGVHRRIAAEDDRVRHAEAEPPRHLHRSRSSTVTWRRADRRIGHDRPGGVEPGVARASLDRIDGAAVGSDVDDAAVGAPVRSAVDVAEGGGTTLDLAPT